MVRQLQNVEDCISEVGVKERVSRQNAPLVHRLDEVVRALDKEKKIAVSLLNLQQQKFYKRINHIALDIESIVDRQKTGSSSARRNSVQLPFQNPRTPREERNHIPSVLKNFRLTVPKIVVTKPADDDVTRPNLHFGEVPDTFITTTARARRGSVVYRSFRDILQVPGHSNIFDHCKIAKASHPVLVRSDSATFDEDQLHILLEKKRQVINHYNKKKGLSQSTLVTQEKRDMDFSQDHGRRESLGVLHDVASRLRELSQSPSLTLDRNNHSNSLTDLPKNVTDGGESPAFPPKKLLRRRATVGSISIADEIQRYRSSALLRLGSSGSSESVSRESRSTSRNSSLAGSRSGSSVGSACASPSRDLVTRSSTPGWIVDTKPKHLSPIVADGTESPRLKLPPLVSPTPREDDDELDVPTGQFRERSSSFTSSREKRYQKLSKVEEEPGTNVVQNGDEIEKHGADVERRKMSRDDSNFVFHLEVTDCSTDIDHDANNNPKPVKTPKSILRCRSPTAGTVKVVHTVSEEGRSPPRAGSIFGGFPGSSMFGSIPSFGDESINDSNKLTTAPNSNSSSGYSSPKLSPGSPRLKSRRVSFSDLVSIS